MNTAGMNIAGRQERFQADSSGRLRLNRRFFNAKRSCIERRDDNHVRGRIIVCMNKQDALIAWYKNAKRDLPFRRSRNPYHIWISEIMAQQTRIEAMLPYYERFIAVYPDIPALAAADEEQLLKLWQGLGYYSRARNLKKAAIVCMEQYEGHLPQSFSELKKLPGIGEYTAGAIASIAWSQRVSAIDGNVIRVYSRMLHETGDVTLAPVKKRLKKAVEEDLPDCKRMADWNQALMELGARVCRPSSPDCPHCPWKAWCLSEKEGDAASLPVKKAKKARVIEEKTFYIQAAKRQNAWYVMLERQPEQGLLASLYLFCQNRPHGILKTFPLRDARHVFTHREWHMKGEIVITEYQEGMTAIEQLEKEKPLPSAMASFYRQLMDWIIKYGQ